MPTGTGFIIPSVAVHVSAFSDDQETVTVSPEFIFVTLDVSVIVGAGSPACAVCVSPSNDTRIFCRYAAIDSSCEPMLASCKLSPVCACTSETVPKSSESATKGIKKKRRNEDMLDNRYM